MHGILMAQRITVSHIFQTDDTHFQTLQTMNRINSSKQIT